KNYNGRGWLAFADRACAPQTDGNFPTRLGVSTRCDRDSRAPNIGSASSRGRLHFLGKRPKIFEKRLPLFLKPLFQSFGAITVAARPRFGAVFVPAIFAVMRVLDA